MIEDRYPVEYLTKRLFDVGLFVIAALCLVMAIFIGVFVDNPGQKIVVGLGMAASAIGVLFEYRQKTVYESDPIESTLLSNGLQVKYLNAVAKLRHKLVASNIFLVVLGILVSGYGTVWGTP